MPQYVFRMMRIPELLRKKVFKPLNPWKNFVNTTIPIMKEVVIEHLKATKDNNVIMFHDLTAFLWREFWEGSTLYYTLGWVLSLGGMGRCFGPHNTLYIHKVIDKGRALV